MERYRKPLGDQRIRKLLAKVGTHLTYALDNISISTYSETIPVAEYGHAKRDPDLKQLNYTFVCEQADRRNRFRPCL